MKFVLFALILIGISAAQAAPESRSLTCAQARKMLRAKGELWLSTGWFSVERFVAHPSWCGDAEVFDGVATTSDRAACALGYVCRSPHSPGDSGGVGY